ncbi:MAG TPA: DNA polymerase III subunit gamma/tau [Firmicutes bacterium]|nr:DNA polymerase III subunit gamma/tau [Bacillota bacterium]
MGRLSLYRKWRPQEFKDVAGQEHIISTLQNAIETGRVAHAYLFAGPRGTGKTTTARLLAKALNCVNGPTSSPCDECESCIAIREGRSLDVFEIDGASNRGIDEIRELRETVRFKATQGNYKVYIIDEVHMLTTEAFNALLKTLEEPPEHVIFVFATTEPQKIPATILSRCQRFTFRRIPSDVIVQRLTEISEKEGIQAEEGALRLLAETAQGGMRDAISLLDQSIAFSENIVTTTVVQDMLGLTDAQALNAFYQVLISKDLTKGLSLIKSASEEGKDLVHFMESAMQVARGLLVVKADKDAPLQSGEILLNITREESMELAAKFDSKYLVRIIETLAETIQKAKRTADPELFFELSLVKLTEEPVGTTQVDAAAIIEFNKKLEAQSKKIQELEQKIKEGRSLQVENSDINLFWEGLLQQLKSRKDTLEYWAFLNVAEPVALEGIDLYISFPDAYEFHRANVENPKNKSLIEQKLEELTGKALRLRIDESPKFKRDPNFLTKTQEVFGGKIIKPE